jgi:hypothetical protein
MLLIADFPDFLFIISKVFFFPQNFFRVSDFLFFIFFLLVSNVDGFGFSLYCLRISRTKMIVVSVFFYLFINFTFYF